jgi:thioredoxin 1
MPGRDETFAGMPTPVITLYDFTAEWCGPCRTLAPILAELAADYAGRVAIVAIDVDAQPELAQQYAVRSMPTMVLVRDGREVGRMVGTRPRPFIAGVIERALAGDVAIASP